MKYTNTHPAIFLAAVVVMGSALYLAPSVEAQSRWRGISRDRESRGIERQIDRLGRDAVEDLPIPVLLGATLQNISPNFGDPRGGGTRQHEGHDTMAKSGTPIVSPTEAVVTRIGNGASSGIFVNTANPGGESFVYMHLSGTADIRVGDELEVGDLIGFVGNTGNAEGGAAHLHFEIRDGRTPLDPYPRFAREFTPSEKSEYLERMLDGMSSRDRDDMVDFLVDEYRGELTRIRTLGESLPRELEDAISGIGSVGSSGSIARDLSVGVSGEDVRTLQVFLIGRGYLSSGSATGYFGPLTQSAVMSYQREKGISPVSGYVGPLTRDALSRDTGGGVPVSGMTEAEMRAKIVELQKMLDELMLEFERQLGI